DEADPVGNEDVKQQQRRRQQRTQPVKLAARRRRLAALEGNDLFLFFEGVTDPERDGEPAQSEPRADHQRKHVRADRLAGHRRKLPAAIGCGCAKANEKQSRDAIGKTHERALPASERPEADQALERPAAFIATPIAASPLSMKAANSPALPHTVPKPRLAMNSLNSFESKTFFRESVSLVATSAGRPFGPAIPRQAPVA